MERVRRIKSRMVRLTTRVETMREVLEKFLDDDSDMHDMNLTARQQDMLERQNSLIRNSLARNSLKSTPCFILQQCTIYLTSFSEGKAHCHVIMCSWTGR